MADGVGGRPKNALMKRHDQLERWKESELSKVNEDRSKAKVKVKFNSGCVFLASCSSGDQDEVKTLLEKAGADINYANVDGLAALHQAVIDEKCEMCEFLIENGADIEAQDNEGWTPLHAAASCGFTDIAKFLIDSGANVSACNNEGELPIDLAEEEDMEELLNKEIKKQGIDVEVAKNEEERKMVEDANQMLNSKNYKDRRHPYTGATPLHVAAAKGYIKCMNILIQAGADVNAIDVDNWTALHAASHWGHKEAAEILAEALADMEFKNKLGQTCFDLAEDDMIKCLDELKKKQASIKREKKPSAPRIESKAPPPLKRSDGQSGSRSSSSRLSMASVTRISAPDRNMLLHQDMAAERKQLEMKIHGEKVEKTMASSSSSESESESSDEDVRKKSNKLTSSKKEVPSFSPKPLSTTSKNDAKKEDTPAWRQSAGLRKTGSTSTIPDSRNQGDRVQRSATSPQLSATTTITSRPRESTDNKTGSRRTKDNSHEGGEENSDSLFTRRGSLTRRRIVADITTDEEQKVPERTVSNNTTTTLISTITTSTTTPVVTTATTTIPTTTNVKRSYMTPAKDDEAETVRRAKAKRERSTRRSTQGVTAEDIESAYDTLRKGDDKASKGYELPSRRPRVGRVIVENSQDTNPIRARRLNQDSTANDTTTTFSIRPRVSSSSDTSSSTTLTARSRYGRATDEDKAKEKEKEEEDNEDAPKKETLTPTATTTITRRQPRERRRATGVISLDEEEEEPSRPTSTSRTSASGTTDRYSRPLSTSSQYSSGSGSGKYDSQMTKSLDTPSSRADRLGGLGSSTSSYSSRDKDKAATIPCQNCKKLFEEKGDQISQLQDQVKEKDLEIAELKASRKSDRFETKSVDNEKRERRALERRVSELEEELNKMEKLKADNQRLKDENGALVRVISKLSK